MLKSNHKFPDVFYFWINGLNSLIHRIKNLNEENYQDYAELMSASVHKIGCGGTTFEESGKLLTLIACAYGPVEYKENVPFYEVHRPQTPKKVSADRNQCKTVALLPEVPKKKNCCCKTKCW